MSDTILLVDDEPSVLSAISRSLRGEPFEVESELSGEAALMRMAQQTFKVVVSDERMARMQGSEFLAIARKNYPGTVRILLTGQASLDAAMRAVNEGGVYKFLLKPWDEKELKQIIRDAIIKHDTEQEAWRIFGKLGKQQQDLDRIEQHYPGISKLDRDAEGSLLLPDLTDDELEMLRIQCEQSFLGENPSADVVMQVSGMLMQKIQENVT